MSIKLIAMFYMKSNLAKFKGPSYRRLYQLIIRAVEKDGPTAACPQALRRHRNNRKYGVSKQRFPRAVEFLRKLSEIWARAFKKVLLPCPMPKKA